MIPPPRWWPDALPFDAALHRRALAAGGIDAVVHALRRRERDTRARAGGRGLPLAPRLAVLGGVGVAASVLAAGPHGGLVRLAISLAGLALAAAAFGAWCMLVRRPRDRALHRGVGLPVCVACGHVTDPAVRAASCPECGFDHACFPVGWLFDVGIAFDLPGPAPPTCDAGSATTPIGD